MRITWLLLTVLIMPLSAISAEAPKKPASAPLKAIPPPPPLPERSPGPAAAEPEPTLEPEITITTRGDAKHEEYRVNGKLYMIKVTPKQGKSYYLIDEDGSGQLHRSDLETKISIPHWIIKSW